MSKLAILTTSIKQFFCQLQYWYTISKSWSQDDTEWSRIQFWKDNCSKNPLPTELVNTFNL